MNKGFDKKSNKGMNKGFDMKSNKGMNKGLIRNLIKV